MILPATASLECGNTTAAFWFDPVSQSYYVTVDNLVIARHGKKGRERAYRDYHGALEALEAERYGGTQP